MDRWFVFKDKGQLGPFDARELRDSLRAGVVDPFDLVCKEGASIEIKRPLVEVDEIFQVEDDLGAKQAPAETKTVLTAKASPAQDLAPQRKVPAPAPVAEPPEEKEPVPAQEQKPPLSRPPFSSPFAEYEDEERKHKKQYFAINMNNDILGPLAKEEVISLFQKGVLDSTVKIKKLNSTLTVPVAKFVQAYVAAAPRNHDGTITGRAIVSSVHMMRLAAVSLKRRMLIPIASVALLVVACLIGFWAVGLLPFGGIFSKTAFSSRSGPTDAHEARTVAPPRPRHKVERHVFQQPLQEAASHPEQNMKPPERTPAPTQVAAHDKKLAFKEKMEKMEKAKPQPKKQRIKPQEHPPQTVALAQPQPVQQSVPLPSAQAPVQIPAPQQQQPTPQPIAPPQPTQPVAAPKPAQVASVPSVGQAITLSGVNYSKSQLDSCALKCTISVTDGSGKPYTVTFFTGQFIDILRTKNGPATFQGTVGLQGGRQVLVLRQVQ